MAITPPWWRARKRFPECVCGRHSLLLLLLQLVRLAGRSRRRQRRIEHALATAFIDCRAGSNVNRRVLPSRSFVESPTGCYIVVVATICNPHMLHSNRRSKRRIQSKPGRIRNVNLIPGMRNLAADYVFYTASRNSRSVQAPDIRTRAVLGVVAFSAPKEGCAQNPDKCLLRCCARATADCRDNPTRANIARRDAGDTKMPQEYRKASVTL
jgi:hypothetical protein